MNTIPVKEQSFGISGKVKIITSKVCSVCGPDDVCTHAVGSMERPIMRETEDQPNLIMLGTNTGKSLILQRLASTNTYTLNLNYGALGTSATAPAISDTQLTSESARSVVANSSIASNQLTIQFFFADANLANGSYNEFGTFVDGTASANTGQIFNHILFGTTYAKVSGEDTTVQLVLTIS